MAELLALMAGEAAGEGSAPDLPLLEERFPESWRGGAGRRATLRALGRELASEARFGFARVRRRLPKLAVAAVGGSRVATWDLTREQTAGVLAGLRRRRLTLNSALVACWSAAFAAARYGGRGGPVRVFTMAGLRRVLRPPLPEEAIGSGWAMMRSTHDVPPPAVDVSPFAADVGARLHDAVARGHAFASYLTSQPMMRIVLGPVKQRMGELAVSYTGVARIAPRHGDLALAALHVFVSTMDVGPALVVHHRIWEGRLYGGLVFHDHDLGAATVAAMGDDVRKHLLALATVGELPALIVAATDGVDSGLAAGGAGTDASAHPETAP